MALPLIRNSALLEEATKIYEEGIHSGSLSTLARQYGDGLVNLTVGNIRPGEKVVVLLELLAGVELHDGGLRLRFPFTLAPSYHSQARGMEVAPGVIELELPTEPFGDLILPQFVRDAEHLHQVGFCLDVRLGSEIREIASPSHALRIQTNDAQSSNVSLSRESDMPDRDLVLDVRTKSSAVSVIGGVDTEGKGRFAAIVPSTEFGKPPAAPADWCSCWTAPVRCKGARLIRPKRRLPHVWGPFKNSISLDWWLSTLRWRYSKRIFPKAAWRIVELP